MKQIYDWDSNTIYWKSKYGKTFNLELRGDKNIVGGDSSTGKTFLCDAIKRVKENFNNDAEYRADNIILLDQGNKELLKNCRRKLIIIDKAELLLNKYEENFIDRDQDNRYLIFARKYMGIGVTPNHFAIIIDKDENTKELHYWYNVPGWC